MHPENEYFEHLRAGRFMLLRSASTGRYCHYPRVAAPSTGERDLEWVPACGDAVVYATTVVRQKAPSASYNLALIELNEGPRLMSRVEDVEADQVRIGMRVKALIRQQRVRDEDHHVLVFVPVNQ